MNMIPDREKVIKGLTELYDEAYERWVHCQYTQDKLVILIRGNIPNALSLLKDQEAKELTVEEWQEWKKDKNHDPICLLWEHDCTPIWILDANHVHEPALLMGKCKLFKGKPSHEQCKAVRW